MTRAEVIATLYRVETATRALRAAVPEMDSDLVGQMRLTYQDGHDVAGSELVIRAAIEAAQ